jgi:hypothetical protein
MAKYLSVLLVSLIASLIVFLPTHLQQRADFEALTKIFMSSGDLVFFGNSVIRTPSKCDSDRRSIVEMMEAPNIRKNIDASRGGMPLGTMLDLLEIATSIGVRPGLVVLPLNPYDSSFRDAAQKSGIRSYIDLNFPGMVDGHATVDGEYPESFAGRVYGNYKAFSGREFILEKKSMKCPENVGKDTDFVRFMYFRNYISRTQNDIDPSDLIHRINSLQAKGLKILVVLMPVNIDDIQALHGPEAAQQVRDKTTRALKQLGSLNVLDLSFSLGAGNFTDRYCACGHLNQIGRAVVAKNVSDRSVLLSKYLE